MLRSKFYKQCWLIARVSRVKEQTFYFCDKNHRWNPRSQRPELWDFYNTRINKGESIHVLPPFSKRTKLCLELIYQESIEIVPLYLTKERPAAERIGTRIIMNHDRIFLMRAMLSRMSG
jgi:sulfate adenylyltransferase subunit 2